MKEQALSKNKNICFIANFYKTFFFHEIAKHLEKEGYIINWIVTKENQYQFLIKKYNENNILLINKRNCLIDNAPIDDFKINELIYGDRVFKYDKINGIKFLSNIQEPIYKFISENNITNIFGEKTWAHELLIHRIITKRKELNCKYYSIATTRIPNGRIIFFKDEKDINIVKPLFSINSNEFINIKIEKPYYLALNDKILKSENSLKGKLTRLKKFFTNENIEKYDPNVLSNNIYRFIIPIREEYNRLTYNFIKKTDYKKIIDEKYILFGFHKQPESSIDVCGRYFEDQRITVLNLWRQLPPYWKLVIKEHSNEVGDRTYQFYRQLLKFPNIVLVNEKSDSHILIKNAQLVATNTGTMALEAALFGIPSITLSKVFFNTHNYCCNKTWVDLEKYSSIIELRNEIIQLEDNSNEYAKYITENSFDGAVGDIDSNPDIINPENIAKVTRAIVHIISQ